MDVHEELLCKILQGCRSIRYDASGLRIVNEEDRSGFPLCVTSGGTVFSLSPDITRLDVIRFFDGMNLTERDVRYGLVLVLMHPCMSHLQLNVVHF